MHGFIDLYIFVSRPHVGFVSKACVVDSY